MRKLATVLLTATALAVLPISSASASTRLEDPSICMTSWHGVIVTAVVRGHVLLKIWGQDGTETQTGRYSPDGYKAVSYYPKPAHYVTGDTITGVAVVAPKSGPYADVQSVTAACAVN